MLRCAYGVTVLLFVALVGAKFDRQTGFTSLIRFGDTWQNKRLGSLEGLPISTVAHSNGYDGQFYAQIALDPLLRDPELARAIDAPAYRAHRILVPAVAALTGGLNPWWTLQAYALLNGISWLALAWVLRTWTDGNSWIGFARWSGCMLSLGVLDSVRQSLVDLPALLLLAYAIRAYNRPQPPPHTATLSSALGNLAKETTLLGVVALNCTDLFNRSHRLSAVWRLALATLPLGIWWLYVAQRFGSSPTAEGLGNFTWPFLGLLAQAKLCLHELLEGNLDGRYSFGFLTIIGLLVQCFALWRTPAIKLPWWRIGAAYSLLLPFLGLWVWSGYWAACRAVLPLTFAFNLLLPINRSFWPLWIVGNLSLLHGIWRFI